MANDFLKASADAAHALEAARRRNAKLKDEADRRLDTAKDRHARDLDRAAAIEASAWLALMAVPGMTVATAGRIGGISEAAVTRWMARARTAAPCT